MQHDSEDVQSFERRSAGYEASIFQGLFFDRIHRVALRAMPVSFEPESIVDIGCGTGRLLRKAGRRWPQAQLTGVDPAEGMVKEARRLTPGAQFHVSLVETLPLPDACADLVMSTVSFHHWQDQVQGIQQAARILRPGGLFVLVDILPPLGLTKMFRHGRQTDPAAVRGMFGQAGLTVREQRRVWGWFLLVTAGSKTPVGKRA